MPVRMLKKDEDTKREKGLKKSKMLSGGQVKLDKNKDGKISGEDFKMMKRKGGGSAISREKRKRDLIKKQNPISEYDKKGKLKYTGASKGTIMKVANKLEKASKAHAGQARTLKSLKLSRGGGAAIRGTNFKGVF